MSLRPAKIASRPPLSWCRPEEEEKGKPTDLEGPRLIGHCILDRPNVGLIPLAAVCASERLPFDMYLISCTECYMENCKLCAFVM